MPQKTKCKQQWDKILKCDWKKKYRKKLFQQMFWQWKTVNPQKHLNSNDHNINSQKNIFDLVQSWYFTDTKWTTKSLLLILANLTDEMFIMLQLTSIMDSSSQKWKRVKTCSHTSIGANLFCIFYCIFLNSTWFKV